MNPSGIEQQSDVRITLWPLLLVLGLLDGRTESCSSSSCLDVAVLPSPPLKAFAFQYMFPKTSAGCTLTNTCVLQAIFCICLLSTPGAHPPVRLDAAFSVHNEPAGRPVRKKPANMCNLVFEKNRRVFAPAYNPHAREHLYGGEAVHCTPANLF